MKSWVQGVVVGALLALCVLGVVACTTQDSARNWGGTANIDLGVGRKLIVVTWKYDDLWILTREMRADEKPETYRFTESSSWGVMEGTVVLKEHATQ